MKVALVFLLIFTVWGAKENKDLKRVEIVLVNKGILTNYQISCSRFDSVFGKIKTIYTVDSKNTLDTLMKMLKDVRVTDFDSKLDVRSKINACFSNGQISTLCFDDFGNGSQDGKKIMNPEALFLFLQKYRKD